MNLLFIMKSFILAILNNWHVFSQAKLVTSQAKLVTIFRNIFILYNKKLLATNSFEDLQQLYGLETIPPNSISFIELYNDLDHANKSTDMVYLHKCTILKNQYNEFIETNMDESNLIEYTYEEAVKKLQEFKDDSFIKNNPQIENDITSSDLCSD